MPTELDGQTVLVVGGARRLGAAIARGARDAGAVVRVTSSAQATPEVLHLDLGVESTIAQVAERLGPIDHVVSTAGANYSAPIRDLDPARVDAAVTAKVTGPLLLAKHLDIRGSLTLFSGQVAWRPGQGTVVTGVTNGALSFTAAHLAAELAPTRVNTLSPGIIDSGLWDAKGDDKAEFLEAAAKRTLVGATGRVQDLVDAVLWILTADFLTGETIRIDGGRR